MYDNNTIERFWKHVDKSSSCWVWKSGTVNGGYGAFSVGRSMLRAHRVSYEIAHGPIPSGMLVCHSCDNPPCVNPAHLWLGTVGDNNRDALSKGRHKPNIMCGEKHTEAKLREEDVILIRRWYAGSMYNMTDLGTLFNVSRTQIGRIVKGDAWR